MKKAFLTAMTAFSLVAVPTVASAAPVQTPLTQPARETVQGDSALHGSPGFIILFFGFVAVGLGIYAGVHGHTSPNSP